MPLTAGARLGPYEIISAPGVGGMSACGHAEPEGEASRSTRWGCRLRAFGASASLAEARRSWLRSITNVDPEPMPLTAGARLGPYEIISALGVGGMGEVYRARDAKLNRDVALKVLPDAFAFDLDRLARFKREAQVLASFNHPNIAAIYGFEESNPSPGSGQAAVQALVLELVEGPTLADLIAGAGAEPRALPIEDALPIAKQIAEALEAAHEQGIIHRDLKPANIKVRSDGTVKVLDFGLAKAMDPVAQAFRPAGSGGPEGLPFDPAASPTITTPAMTRMGMILGTAAYMSPEQAKGRAADKRSDVWAFGCVLYEMLAGRRAFEGEDVSDTMATVLKGEPDWNALPSSLPDAVRALIQGCVRKDRKERIGDISTALFLLNQPHTVAPAAPVSQPLPQRVWRRAALVVAGVVTGAAVTAAVVSTLKRSPTVPVTRSIFTLPQGQLVTQARQAVALSPDGTHMAYAADGRLYLRAMSEFGARMIARADQASGLLNPGFSPDGQSLVFWSDAALKRIAIGGGAAVTICQVNPSPLDLVWSNDGILFSQLGTGIMRVSPAGGKPQTLVGMTMSDGVPYGPQLLPDGQTLLFTIAKDLNTGRLGEAQIVAQSLQTGVRKRLIEGGNDARYVPTGHIVYALGGTLFAVPFDPAKLEVIAGPVAIVEGVRRAGATAQFAFSSSGSLVYAPGPASSNQEELILFDRKGGAEALKLPPGSYQFPRVSPDGKRIALETSEGKEALVSIYELSGTSSVRRLTFGGNNRFPIWSADGRRVAFQSDRDGDLAVFWQPADGGAAERLTKPDPGSSHVPESWSPNGDTFLFSVKKDSSVSLWTFSVRDRKATAFGDVSSSALPTDAVFSPDGHWVAYQIGETVGGEGTTFVQPFPPTGAKYQIARGGRPLWSRDGKELFYVPAPGLFMAVTVRTQPSFMITNPTAVPRGFGLANPSTPRTFDIMPDGRIVGFGIAGESQSGSAAIPQIRIVLNWFEELRARVPPAK